MYVGKNKVGIVLEAIENAIAMMRINIDISDSSDAEFLAQVFDRDATVVEDTKPGSTAPCRMMQACNRHERAPVIVVHDLIDGAQNGPDDSRRGIVDTRHRGRVALIQPAAAQRRHA